jgi:signal transduction histidine kinase
MLRVRDYSISRKLTWMNLLASGVALLLACAAFVAYDLITFRESMIRSLSIQAQIVGSNSVSALLFNDPQSAEKTLSALHNSPNIISAGIYTPDGRPFAAYWRHRGSGALQLPPILTARTQLRLRDGQMVVLRSIVFQGKPAGTVYIQSDLQESIDRLKQYVIIVVAVLLTSLVVALLTSSIIRRAIADPIVQLAETARIVSRDKVYSVRAPTTGNRDELAILIGTFNEMLAQIEERDTALRETRDNLEQRVQERTAQLNAVNLELEAFSYSVSHDLRAPLRHIGGFARLLEEEYGTTLDAAAQGHLRRILSGVENMGMLVDDLLKLGKVGRQELVWQQTDLNSLLQSALQDIQPELEGRQIEWRIGELPVIDCDPGLMKQVFANLLSNAVKYTRRREFTVIQVGHVATDGAPVIFIRDNGAGFNQQYASKLFGAFQRLHRTEDFEGTGIGLATVQRIIRKHGGRIWADGEVEKGATFSFSLAASSQGFAATKASAAVG